MSALKGVLVAIMARSLPKGEQVISNKSHNWKTIRTSASLNHHLRADHILLPQKCLDNISNGSRVIIWQKNRHTHTPTNRHYWKQLVYFREYFLL